MRPARGADAGPGRVDNEARVGANCVLHPLPRAAAAVRAIRAYAARGDSIKAFLIAARGVVARADHPVRIPGRLVHVEYQTVAPALRVDQLAVTDVRG